MQRREVSDTAEPQKARLRCVREGRPRARTSVAVSERAQQKDYSGSISMYVLSAKRLTCTCYNFRRLTRSNSRNPLAAFVRYTIALSVKYVQSARQSFVNRGNGYTLQC